MRNIIAECSGLFIEAITNKHYAITGDTMALSFTINKRNAASITLNSIQLDNYDTVLNTSLPTNNNVVINTPFLVRKDKPLYQPYWLRNAHSQGSFNIDDQRNIGKSENDADYVAIFNITVNGTTISCRQPLQYKYADAVKGEIYEPVRIIAPFCHFCHAKYCFIKCKNRRAERRPDPELKITVKSNITAAQLPVTVKAMQGKKIIFSKDTLINIEAGKEYLFATDMKKNS